MDKHIWFVSESFVGNFIFLNELEVIGLHASIVIVSTQLNIFN